MQVITAAGRRLWVRSLGEAVHDAEGQLVRIQGVVQDVSSRRGMEQELQSLAMRLSTTLASITEAFATLDRHGRFTFVNTEGERLLRRSRDALVGEEIWVTLDAKDEGRLRGAIARALRLPSGFPYSISRHSEELMTIGYAVMLAIGYYILNVPLHTKLVRTAGILIFLAVLVPHQVLAQAFLLQHMSVLFMPVLYICMGAVFDALVFVALYSWAVSDAPAEATH